MPRSTSRSSLRADDVARYSAHASYSPWEAQNALDAAFMAYSGIAVMRQQMKPTCRVHGIVIGKDWQPNGELHSLSARVNSPAASSTEC